uniref:Uncharacterized protein n=1 Tax=Tetraselmis sp. GSL018 TaxID=582737 RepID=A0A061SGW9_9CHLO
MESCYLTGHRSHICGADVTQQAAIHAERLFAKQEGPPWRGNPWMLNSSRGGIRGIGR